jgi:hypothetical protein
VPGHNLSTADDTAVQYALSDPGQSTRADFPAFNLSDHDLSSADFTAFIVSYED